MKSQNTRKIKLTMPTELKIFFIQKLTFSYFLKLLIGVIFAATSSLSGAQMAGQTIKIVVPFTPGTGYDTIARAIQPKLSERLNQTVLVQNMPGASGNIGTDYVAKANPDGSTILMGGNTMTMASQMYKNATYQPVRDFTPVSMAAYGTFMLVAHPKLGAKSVADLIALAKAKPGFVTFGSPGVGTPHHMAMELFKNDANLFMLHVPYKGTAGYTQDLLAGEIMTGFLPVHVAQGFVNSGQLIALGVGSAKRHPVAPNVPTFVEQGIKKFDVDLWYGFFYPVKTPSPIVDRLNKELVAILSSSDIKEILGKAGLDAYPSTSADLGQVLAKDYLKWGALIKSKGITFD